MLFLNFTGTFKNILHQFCLIVFIFNFFNNDFFVELFYFYKINFFVFNNFFQLWDGCGFFVNILKFVNNVILKISEGLFIIFIFWCSMQTFYRLKLKLNFNIFLV